MLLSGSVVTLFMMALQSASTCASSWTWEGNLEEEGESKHLHYFTFGQGWLGLSTLLYALVAAAHLGMMCLWRDVDVDAYEAVPMSVVRTTTSTTYGGGMYCTPTSSSKVFSSNSGRTSGSSSSLIFNSGEGTVPEGDDNFIDGDEYDDTMEFDESEYQQAT